MASLLFGLLAGLMVGLHTGSPELTAAVICGIGAVCMSIQDAALFLGRMLVLSCEARRKDGGE